jgi:hypothetical protein
MISLAQLATTKKTIREAKHFLKKSNTVIFVAYDFAQ